MRRDRCITDVPVGSGDPLWLLEWMDERFEPRDPLFDGEEPPPRPPKRRKARGRSPVLPLVAAALLLTAAACGGRSAHDEHRPLALHATDAILVQLEQGATPPRPAPDDGSGPPIVALVPAGPADEAPLLRMRVPAGTDAETFALSVASQPGVAFAEPVYLYRTARSPNDPRFKDLWGLAQIDAPGAWRTTTGDRSTVVAILDDGVGVSHPDLAANIWSNPEANAADAGGDLDSYTGDRHGWNFIEGTSDVSPGGDTGRWHGTHVAGIVGAVGGNHLGIAGVSWHVAIMPLRALAAEGRSDLLAQAIDYAVDRGARVINASWGGGGRSRALENAIARAGRRGTLFVAAAGNDSTDALQFPAALTLENVLSVGATGPDDRLALFSNRGALVAAPGVGILSTTAPGQYERYDGTSMAAPHVTGLAALLWSAYPDATLGQVRDAILESGVPVDGVQRGRIDARHALANLDAAPRSNPKLRLSRTELSFNVAEGRIPRAQLLELRTDSGRPVPFTATTSAPWLRLSVRRNDTPARVAVRVDPSKLAPAGREAEVTFTAADGSSVVATIAARPVARQTIAANGMGCDLHGGVLRARAGCACTLSIDGAGEAPSIRWRLPGGALASGARLHAQFIRPGEYNVLVSADEGEVDALKVVIQ